MHYFIHYVDLKPLYLMHYKTEKYKNIPYLQIIEYIYINFFFWGGGGGSSVRTDILLVTENYLHLVSTQCYEVPFELGSCLEGSCPCRQ